MATRVGKDFQPATRKDGKVILVEDTRAKMAKKPVCARFVNKNRVKVVKPTR